MVYRFGDFTLDLGIRQLSTRRTEVHLSPKGFELLATLLANKTRAMSKGELQEHLWPSTFVEETNLAGLIAEIRKALQDSASNPAYVRTVYGFGYRFVGEVIVETAPALQPPRRAAPCLVLDNRECALIDGANVIGREPGVTIHVDSPGVSRHHARIVVVQGSATIEDLGSKNGTQLNGRRLTQPARLSDGDQIALGAIRLTFRNESRTSPTETVVPDGA